MRRGRNLLENVSPSAKRNSVLAAMLLDRCCPHLDYLGDSRDISPFDQRVRGAIHSHPTMEIEPLGDACLVGNRGVSRLFVQKKRNHVLTFKCHRNRATVAPVIQSRRLLNRCRI